MGLVYGGSLLKYGRWAWSLGCAHRGVCCMHVFKAVSDCSMVCKKKNMLGDLEQVLLEVMAMALLHITFSHVWSFIWFCYLWGVWR